MITAQQAKELATSARPPKEPSQELFDAIEAAARQGLRGISTMDFELSDQEAMWLLNAGYSIETIEQMKPYSNGRVARISW
jgi:hypothetical protein